MAQVYECTFSNVNGENTGVWTRTRMTKTAPSAGILLKKNCPDNLHFYCDPNDGGTNNYYKLIDPGKYPGIDASVGTVYVWLSTSYLVNWKLVDDPREVITPEPAPKVEANRSPTVPIRQESTVNDSLTTSNIGNIYNSTATSSNDDISTYISYTGKSANALTPKGKFNEYNGNVSDNYFMQYNSILNDINIIENNLNIALNPSATANLKNNMMTKFNRFLIAFPDSALPKTFAHVFFTRPDLNLYNTAKTKLLDTVDNDPYFHFLHNNSPDLLKSLTQDFSNLHDFNPLLSNKAGSFELKDELIETDEYGETFTGWKIKYGKSNIRSKSADSFSITYTDDNNYNIYKIHKAWTDYISKVYKGEFKPSEEYIKSRTIDYAAAVYYILCGPDGETILFWSKYTGVFPTNTPSSASSWQKGNLVKMPEFTINYEFSWKEDMMPSSLTEFNIHSKNNSIKRYAKTYESALVSTGKTFVNAPFVETVRDSSGKYEYKLRFRP